MKMACTCFSLAILFFLSCKQTGNELAGKGDSLTTLQSAEPPQSMVGWQGIQGDSLLMFTIVNESHDGEGKIIVQLAQTPESFLMTKTPVGSGAKFVSEDSFYLWTSGESFTWGKDSVIIAAGVLRK